MKADCDMCHAPDSEVVPVRIELAVAYAKDLARQFDTFPATYLIDYKGLVCPECVKVVTRTGEFFRSQIIARGWTP